MAHRVHLSVSMMLLPPSDDYCDLLLNRPMATWNLFVFFLIKKRQKLIMMMSSLHLSFKRSKLRTNQNICVFQLLILFTLFKLNLACAQFCKFGKMVLNWV